MSPEYILERFLFLCDSNFKNEKAAHCQSGGWEKATKLSSFDWEYVSHQNKVEQKLNITFKKHIMIVLKLKKRIKNIYIKIPQ